MYSVYLQLSVLLINFLSSLLKSAASLSWFGYTYRVVGHTMSSCDTSSMSAAKTKNTNIVTYRNLKFASMHTSKLRIHEQSQVVSSRRLVSWGAGRKLAHEKRGEKHLAPTLSPVFRSAFCFFRTTHQLPERVEEARTQVSALVWIGLSKKLTGLISIPDFKMPYLALLTYKLGNFARQRMVLLELKFHFFCFSL